MMIDPICFCQVKKPTCMALSENCLSKGKIWILSIRKRMSHMVAIKRSNNATRKSAVSFRCTCLGPALSTSFCWNTSGTWVAISSRGLVMYIFLSITLEWKYCPQLMQRFLGERMIGCCPQLKWLFYLCTGEQIMRCFILLFCDKIIWCRRQIRPVY